MLDHAGMIVRYMNPYGGGEMMLGALLQGTENKNAALRLREMVTVLRRHDIVHGLTPEKLRAIFEDLGPTFVKFGQIMSMRPDFLPTEYCDELMKLRRQHGLLPSPSSSPSSSRSTIATGTRSFARSTARRSALPASRRHTAPHSPRARRSSSRCSVPASTRSCVLTSRS